MYTVEQLQQSTKEELIRDLNCCLWSKDFPICLIPENKWELVPNGTILVSIGGDIVVKGVSDIDLDTRGGYLAYGLIPKEQLKNFVVTNNLEGKDVSNEQNSI